MFEYQVVPAPKKGIKAKGIRTNEERFAFAMSEILNNMASEGWEYQRAETLPAEERSGLTGKTTVFKNMLVFRRSVEEEPQVADVAEVQTPIIKDVAVIETETPRSLPSAAHANQVPETHVDAPSIAATSEKV